MADTHYEELVERVLQLPYDQQLQLMDRLQGTLHASEANLPAEKWKEAWLPEIRRRMAETDAGASGIAAEEVLGKLRGRNHAEDSS
jgi:hypothetical protein